MGKNKKNKANEPGKQAEKAGQHQSGKKFKRDGKPKKAKEDQEFHDIPFRLREIMKSKERMKNGPLKGSKLKNTISPKGKPEDSQAGDIPVPHFKRGKQEGEKAYVRRMENETQHVLFLTKNQVDRKPELADDQQEKPADNKGKSDKKKEHDKSRLQRLKLKKLDKQEDLMEKEMFVDYVPFGEVSLAPPSLSAKHARKTPVKPQKELLLHSLMGHTATSTSTSTSTAKPSMARQRMIEEERQRVVEAYRHLKKQKQLRYDEAKAASRLKKHKNLKTTKT